MSISVTWLNTEFEYSGEAEVIFEEPQVTLYGPACVRFCNDRPRVDMTIERSTRALTSDLDVLELTYSATPQPSGARVIGIGGHQNRVRVRVKGVAGEFQSGPDWDYQFSPITAARPIRLQITAMKAEFSASTVAEQFLVLPLAHFRTELPHDRSVIKDHPLCLDPENSSRFVAFTIENRVGFIQQFPQTDDPASPDENAGITAVAVIPLTDRSMTDPWGWFLNIFLRLLSFASGCDVVCRWIETRDGEGHLVRRIHLPIGNERARAKGYAAISKAVHWRDGAFLTAALASQEVREPFFSIALRHCIRAAQSGMTLDDELCHLMRGFECLCLRFETNKQDLLKSLDSSLSSQIIALLSQAAGQIRSLAGIPAADRTIVSRVAERTRSAAQADKSFGLGVQMLVQKFGLRDPEVLAAFYQDHPGPGGRDWVQTLAYFRGAVFHEGYLDIDAPGTALGEVLGFVLQLHDLLVRILLKIIGYDGLYQPRLIRATAAENADWFKPGIAIKSLMMVETMGLKQ